MSESRPQQILDAVADRPAPLAVLDLDAFDRNARALLELGGGLPIRVGSKSVRCLDLIRRALDAGFQGVLAFTPHEALHLARNGIEDILVAYPNVDPASLDAVAAFAAAGEGSTPILMVDCDEHIEAISQAARAHKTTIEVCIDIDLAWWRTGGRVRIGPKRSPIRHPGHAARIADKAIEAKGVRPVGLMAYDGQIAGVGDDVPGRRARSMGIRAMQKRSLADIAERLPPIVVAVHEALQERNLELRFANAGGTGSLDRIRTVTGVSELTAGSGLYAPALFDTYSGLDLEPAAFFALPVVRRPAKEVATCLGGGYVASGAAGEDRLPQPYWPTGLRLDGEEGAGEVQTPVLGDDVDELKVGDRVLFRHAKAGELCERFASLALVSGAKVVGEAATYRGEGHTFL